MSIRLMSAVWDSPARLDPTARLVLLSLADQANDEGLCWPAVATVARRCGIGQNTARRWLHDLESAGWLRREERPGTSTRYWLTPPTPGTPPEDGRGTPPEDGTPPLPPVGGEPKENPQGNRHPSPRRSAPVGNLGAAYGAAIDALPGMPEEQHGRTAGDLVAAWVDGYTAARGTPPLSSQVKRMAASAKRLTVDLTDDAAWDAGLHLARMAGRDSFYDLVLAIPRYHNVQPQDVALPWWVTPKNSIDGEATP